ncbi:cytochrome P450 [Lyngbya confervoides]|uniref:Cytochrome P450 n=1 Tax=Lyngbya confervoides BDU141951 TaxID=1574623 RepID=A0ABD4T9R2_9CYAN|nr:cytochrome P450 [Lyngbya confervoides]MCM1985159.1 cytochrome P450 [Lyngbya confervoides BDU141951]
MTLPPGKMGLPILGETLAFFNDPEFAPKRFSQYGPIFKSRILGQPTIFVKGSQANQFVLLNEPERFTVSWPPSTQRLLGPCSLSMQQGHTHRSRRQILAQAFMPRALAGYIPTMMSILERYGDRWCQSSPLTWYPELRHLTLEIACQLLVGLENGSQTSLGKNFEGWTAGLFSLPLPFPWTAFGKALRCRQQLIAEISSIIDHRQSTEDRTDDPASDALGLLLKAEDDQGQRLSPTELNDQILTLLFAGHETLTSGLATFCLQMAQHPAVRHRLRAEIDQQAQDPLTLERIKAMPYLEKVMQEVLRFTPPVAGGFRQVVQDCQFETYTFPKGWQVLYQIAATQSDPSLYPNPDTFDPDRFESEPIAAVPKHGYLPFGGGIRECLGKEFARLEMKLFAIHMLQTYDWQILPDQDLSLTITPTPAPKSGLKVHFCPRRP